MINFTKYKNYLQFVRNSQDQWGFIDGQSGDSLLFTGLASVIPNLSVNLRAAMDPDTGRWARRPLSYGDCYPTVSKSQISRDMLLGVLYSAYYNKDLELSESVIKYAFKHFGVMGKGVISRTLISLPLLSTAAWISYKLGGPKRRLLRKIPYIGQNSLKGFEAHLQVLHTLLREDLGTPDSSKYRERYYLEHVGREPDNALFLYACGFTGLAEAALDEEKHFPTDRAPNTKDRSEGYLWQRDSGTDWEPSDERPAIRHSGLDYLFVAWLLLKDDIP